MENNYSKRKKLLILIVAAFLVVSFAIFVTLLFRLSPLESVVMYWILTTFYAIFGFYVVGATIIEKEIIRYVDKPVYINREVPIQIPIERNVVEVIEKPVIENVPVYIERKVETNKRKLNIPHYDYVGSNETMRYHKRSCRLSKLIKRKHLISNNDKNFFRKNGFKPCKACLKR